MKSAFAHKNIRSTLLIQLVIFAAIASASKGSAASAERKPTPDELAFFEKKIRPVLADKCYKCHSTDAERVKGGLALDTRDGIRMGGDTGHAVVPGDLKSSLLIKAIRYDDSELQMPPKKEGGKLSAEVIADFETWVKMGAPDPRESKVGVAKKGLNLDKAREFWAFQTPKKVPAPTVKNKDWAYNDLDKYVLAQTEAKGLRPVNNADKRSLIRRVYYDLIGLPPTPEAVEAFANDPSPDAYEKVVKQLLASSQFGEKWGRHWLDVARYAESSGKENNITYPHAWRYRDYVINAINADKPYDRFLKEQLAGDLLPVKNDQEFADNLIATGFLAVGPKSHNTRERRQFQLDVADEQIDAVTQGMLGLTVACARCHDHKFDPVPTHDYYALAGIFLSTETMYGTPQFVQNNQPAPLLMLPESAKVTQPPALSAQQIANMKRQLEENKKERDEIIAEARKSKDRTAFANPRFLRSNTLTAILEKQLARYDANGQPLKIAMGVQDRDYPRDTQILVRGEAEKPGETVPRGFLQVINTKQTPAIKKGSGRLELAEWIASPENPLTARVMVNRIWLHLLGTGIVPSPDNFGTTGQLPTNQPLLDYLAISFVENGWSIKKMVQQIVLSHTYQLGSEYNAADYALDPDNTYLWRMSKRRLEAEEIRDAMLQISGKLDLTPPHGSPTAPFEGPVVTMMRFGALNNERNNRSVYMPIVRDQVPDSLAVFDFAEPSLVIGDREDTTVPSQALYLMNSQTVERYAEGMADRLLAKPMAGGERSTLAFQMVYSRPPTSEELKVTGEFFKRFYAAEGKKGWSQERLGRAALVAFCQALLGSAEFRYLN